MRPGARLRAAIELCQETASGARPPEQVLERYFRNRRYAGAKDRRAIGERLFGLLRRRARLDWWIERVGGVTAGDPRSRVIADLALCDGAQAGEIDGLFDGTRYGPAPLTDGERALAGALLGKVLDDAEMPDWVALEYPPWLDGELRRSLGRSLGAGMAALNREAPVDLRVNTLRTTRAGALEALAGEGIEAVPTPLSPVGLRLAGRRRLGGLGVFRRGLVEVQDEGSQLVAMMTDARPGHRVIDFCAGAGGKTLALAAAMGAAASGNGGAAGTLIACDVSAPRLERLKERSRRAGARVERRLLSPAEDPWMAANQGRAQRVLADVPCSATGVWRRRPDARWNLSEERLGELMEEQDRILAAAGRLVAPGGRLVHATCSLLECENADRVEKFLDAHPDFSLLPAAQAWAGTVGGDCPSPGRFLRLGPASTGTDGFFCAVLERRG